MSSSRNMMKSLFKTGMLLSVLLVAPSLLLGADQYWNPTTTKQGAGSGVWATDAGAWANTSAGTNSPVPWVNGNNAFLTLNSGVNTGTVNGVTANRLNISQGTYVFNPGTGPLTISGSLTNTGGTVTFNADVVMSSDQNWDVRALTKINGTLTGPYTLKKTGGSSLVLSNANNNIAGLFLDSYYVQAYGGGNTVGGPGVALTMGSPIQATTAKLELYPLSGQSETVWNIGSVTANGFGEINFKSTSDAVTNRVACGDLTRTNFGVLSLRQEASNFEIRQYVTFSNANEVVVNGMLPPWVVTPTSGDFLAYDGLVKTLLYKTTAPNTWTVSDVVNNTSVQTLTADAAVYALRVTSDLTIPSGLTLTNASGGLLLIGKTLFGNGTLATGPNEMIVYATGTSAIYPRISANGLTVWGGGTLTVSNITWSGDTWLQQGNLTVALSEDTVYTNAVFGALGNGGNPGAFNISGSGSFTFLNSNSRFPKLALAKNNMSLVITNSQLELVGNSENLNTASGINGARIDIFASDDKAHPTSVSCSGQGGIIIGLDGSDNALTVDGGGITAGTTLTTWIAPPGGYTTGNGLKIGTGNGASRNRVRIVNGAYVRDTTSVVNAGNGIGVGDNANDNRIEIIGGNGFTSLFYKTVPNSIGSGLSTGNSALIDGKGFPGSAVWQVGNGAGLNVGTGRGFGNFMVITNGGKFTGGSIIVGVNADGNRLDVVGAGSEVVGNGGDTTFSLGTGIASNNVFYVADGGTIRNITKWSTCIGGTGNPAAGNAISNRMIIGANGSFLTGNDANIGRNKDVGSSAIGNSVLVTGPGATWNFSGKTLNIGVEQNGSIAQGNALIVENGGLAIGGYIKVGAMADAIAGGASSGNQLTITSGGLVRLTGNATCGSVSGAASSSGNRVAVKSGGILEANTLVVGAASDNTIAATDGGVFQFTSITPTITSLSAGDIAISNGVVSFTVANSVVGNLTTALTNMAWRGVNAYRLTGTTTTSGSSQKYVFDPGFGSTNYFRLEMVSGNTTYQGIAGDSLTIGQSAGSGGEMLCSNTTARVTMPFIVNGKLRLVNSTLTITTNATVNGEVFIDLANASGSGPFLAAQKNLTLGDSSTLRISGAPVNGQVLMTYSGTRTGKFKVEGLPKDYTIKYDLGEAGTISILHTPTVISIR